MQKAQQAKAKVRHFEEQEAALDKIRAASMSYFSKNPVLAAAVDLLEAHKAESVIPAHWRIWGLRSD